MAHFAKIDNNNLVTEVIVAEKNFINSGLVGDEFLWVQTSYNNNFRKNFAGIGYTYDKTRDAFIPAKPYPSWTLVEDTCQWTTPVAYPADSTAEKIEWDEATTNWKMYNWNEETTNWVEVT